ncbi:hypothetical protein [Actinomadura sp. WMMB 499]|uniref:hypothetical protein n=1 Tax=Actinomadura sp. WMMB 499 TaxID=1219491 RepID=UPI001243D1E8|nr:hypothetical protein [Actinomadura sp. WMMB 499]QFG24313.1 hypothetical protein F7P10_27445 [Actinomadura sp. WMMB 499]
MQLPRVVIAAVFFALAAFIAIPPLVGDDSENATPASNQTTSPSPSPSGSGSGSGAGSEPASPSPSRSASPRPPGSGNAALTAEIGSVACPERTVPVRVRNTGGKPADFSVEKNDDTAAIPGRLAAGESRTVDVEVREDRRTRVRVAWANDRIASETVEANCTGAGSPGDDPSELPYTGQDDGVLWARGATAFAALVTGLIIFWYGGVWPRRKEKMLRK